MQGKIYSPVGKASLPSGLNKAVVDGRLSPLVAIHDVYLLIIAEQRLVGIDAVV